MGSFFDVFPHFFFQPYTPVYNYKPLTVTFALLFSFNFRNIF